MSEPSPDLAEILRRLDALPASEQRQVIQHLAEKLDLDLEVDWSDEPEDESGWWSWLFGLVAEFAIGWAWPGSAGDLLSKLRR